MADEHLLRVGYFRGHYLRNNSRKIYIQNCRSMMWRIKMAGENISIWDVILLKLENRLFHGRWLRIIRRNLTDLFKNPELVLLYLLITKRSTYQKKNGWKFLNSLYYLKLGKKLKIRNTGSSMADDYCYLQINFILVVQMFSRLMIAKNVTQISLHHVKKSDIVHK